MKKVLLLSLLSVTLIYSCKKDGQAGKPASNEGTIRFTNTSSNPYTIYINGGQVGTVTGKKFREYNKEAGNYILKAVQESGYVIYPTVRETSFYLSAGQEKEFVFP